MPTASNLLLEYNTICYICQTTLELTKSLDRRYTYMVISAMLARQITLHNPLPSTLTALLRYSCKLFVAPQKLKSFAIKQIRTLCAKYRGWVPLRHVGRRVSHFRLTIKNSQLTRFQQLAASFISLGSLSRPPILCFQSVAASFAKTGGWVGVQRFGKCYGREVMRDFCTEWR
jgi:hypothetical protein